MGILKNKKKYILNILILFLFSSFVLFAVEERVMEKGIVDLRKVNLKKEGIVKLDGYWKFYWNRFTMSESVDKEAWDFTYQRVPELWINYKIDGKKVPAYGYATYKVKVKRDKTNERLALKIGRLGGVYKLWIDDKLCLVNGKIAREYSEERIEYREETVYFTTNDGEFDIIIEMSNYNYNKGGIWKSIGLGLEKNVERSVNRKIAFDILILGSLILMSILYFLIFSIYKKVKRFLYLAIFSLTIALTYISRIELLYLFFGDRFPEIIKIKLEYISFYLAVSIFFLFIRSIFKNEYSKKIEKLVIAVSTIYIIEVIFMPFRIINLLNYGYQFFSVFLIFNILLGLINALSNKREEAKVVFCSFIFMMISILAEIISAIGIFKLPALGYFGIYIFMLLQVYVNFRYIYNSKDNKKDIETKNKVLKTYTKEINTLMKDIFKFSEAEKVEMELENRVIPLRFLVDLIIFLLKSNAEERGVRLVNEIQSDIKVYADEDRVKQIFYNILGNAIKYSKKTDVKIKAVKNNERIFIEIKDNGVGISEEKGKEIESLLKDKKDLGEKFGLGLSISQKLLVLFDSELRFESKEGIGTSFYFDLEKVSEKDTSEVKAIVYIANEPQRDIEKNRDSNKYKILVVDDDNININVLLGFLDIENYELVTAYRGKDALDILDESFSLVILDVMMPGMSGFEVCQEIRKKYSLSEMPVLMLTAKNQYSDIERGFESGANDYSIKPIEKRELLKRVEALLKLKRTTEERIKKIIEKENLQN